MSFNWYHSPDSWSLKKFQVKHLKGQASTILALPSPIGLQHLTPLRPLRGTRHGVARGQENGHPGHLLGNQVLRPPMPGNACRGVTPPNISVHPSSLSASHPSVILLLSWQQLDLFEKFIFLVWRKSSTWLSPRTLCIFRLNCRVVCLAQLAQNVLPLSKMGTKFTFDFTWARELTDCVVLRDLNRVWTI